MVTEIQKISEKIKNINSNRHRCRKLSSNILYCFYKYNAMLDNVEYSVHEIFLSSNILYCFYNYNAMVDNVEYFVHEIFLTSTETVKTVSVIISRVENGCLAFKFGLRAGR